MGLDTYGFVISRFEIPIPNEFVRAVATASRHIAASDEVCSRRRRRTSERSICSWSSNRKKPSKIQSCQKIWSLLCLSKMISLRSTERNGKIDSFRALSRIPQGPSRASNTFPRFATRDMNAWPTEIGSNAARLYRHSLKAAREPPLLSIRTMFLVASGVRQVA